MTPERLKEIRRQAQLGNMHVSDVGSLLAHISTLESELQQVKVERDGLREALGNAAVYIRESQGYIPKFIEAVEVGLEN